MKSLMKPLILAIGICSAVAYGNTTWQSNRAKYTGASAGGNAALVDMSYWTNGLGQVGSGAPTATDDLIFDNLTESGDYRYRLRFYPGTTGAFKFNSLQIGTAAQASSVVQDTGGGVSFANAENGGLKLLHGNWFFNYGANMQLNCDVTILAENATKPFVMHYGQEQYSNRTASITGKLKGSADAQLVLGPWPKQLGDKPSCAPNTTFALYDLSEYAGTITVTSRFANVVAADETHGFGTCLKFMTGTATSPAKIRVSRGGSLSAQNFGDTVTVKELSLAAGSRLWLNQAAEADGKLWCVKATDALNVERGADKVDIYWKPVVYGVNSKRMPILAGPSDSTFVADDFKISYAPGGTFRNPDLHLEVGTDSETGDRMLYAVVTNLVIDQLSYYDREGERDGTTAMPIGQMASSLTNAAAWRDNLAPHATNSTYIYSTAMNLRTEYAIRQRYEFPGAGFWMKAGGKLTIQTWTFEVPELWCDGGTIAVGQSHNSSYPVSLVAPKIHVLGKDNTVTFRTYSSIPFTLKGEIDGDACINLAAWSGTGMQTAFFCLDGCNTNFTGPIIVRTDETRTQYHNFDTLYPTMYLLDGRNLGGAKAEFDPRALMITTLARLSVTNNGSVTLEDGLNRGLYIKHTGRFHVTGSGTLNVKWPLLLSGKMWKEGTGTLVLGGELKHEAKDGGALTDIPRAGSNLFEIVAGTVKIAHADALAGVETTIKAGATLKLAIDPANADLTAYGIRNTTVDTPFTLDASFGGKLPLTLDTAGAVPAADCPVLTNALVTVKSTSAEAVAEMLPVLRPWSNYGYASTVVPRANADDTTTLLLVSKFKGMTLYLR